MKTTHCKDYQAILTAMNKILIVEDDALFGESLGDFLLDAGFETRIAKTIKEALDHSYKERFNLYLFDINLPDGNGLELLEDLQRSGDNTPAIYLTSFKDKDTLLKGFKSGCDDYLRKPCDMDELLMRIHAVLKRNGQVKTQKTYERFTIDSINQVIYENGQLLNLPKKVALLFEFLVDNQEQIVSQEMIAEKLWDLGEDPSFGSIRVYINRLNKLITPKKINNIKGIGYRLV